jgi:hypothetical protein
LERITCFLVLSMENNCVSVLPILHCSREKQVKQKKSCRFPRLSLKSNEKIYMLHVLLST